MYFSFSKLYSEFLSVQLSIVQIHVYQTHDLAVWTASLLSSAHSNRETDLVLPMKLGGCDFQVGNCEVMIARGHGAWGWGLPWEAW